MSTPDKKLLIVLITGGTDGLGRGAAEYLAARGYRVFAGSRNAQRRAEFAEFAQKKKLPIDVLPLDVTDDASVDAAVREVERLAGPVEILINNAGIGIGAMMEEITIADLYKQFETNFFGVMRVTRRVLPEMRRVCRGRIINISSIAGKVSGPMLGPYCSSKHALEGASDALRLELKHFGIPVVLIEPGYIPTNINRNAVELSAAYAAGAEKSPYREIYNLRLRAWKKETSSSRYTPEDCARAILRAIEDNPPHARYLVTRPAKVLSLLKRILPDSLFDRMTWKLLGLDKLGKSVPAEKTT